MKQENMKLWFHLIDRLTTLLVIVVKGAVAIWIAYYATAIVQALAGKETNANFSLLVDLFARFDSFDIFPWAFGVICLIFAYRERREKQRKTEYFQERIRELEIRLDPSRTSSGLAESGETNKEDKV